MKHAQDSEILQYALDYFQKYINMDTISDPDKEACPSNPAIKTMAGELVQDLQALGITARMDEHAYVYAGLAGNTPARHTIGFIAHMDSSPDFPASPMNARRMQYTGEDIVLNAQHPAYLSGEEEAIVLSDKVFPQLKNLVGQDLVVTDGHTLLSADDKAGLAEIMAFLKYLTQHPEIPHGDIKVAFTPDEEIGRGADLFDTEIFGADYAYTMDGGPLGEVEWENFNAASAHVQVLGRNVHPGSAKNKMINSAQVAMDFHQSLPNDQRPENTEGYVGFYHLTSISGDVESTRLHYIIRDFDKNLFEDKKDCMLTLARTINEAYGWEVVKVTITDSYFNMREKILPVMFLVDYAKEAMAEVGVAAREVPIRGGTDGARLSYMGLPCPNLFTGGDNYHGRFEYLAVETMEKALEMMLKLVQKFI